MSKCLKFALTADWHLAKGAWARYPKIQGDAQYSLEQIVDLCLSADLDLIGAGDLFDVNNPPTSIINFAFEQIRRLTKENRFLYIQGDHDHKVEVPWFKLLDDENVYHLHNRVYAYKDIIITGLDFCKYLEFDEGLELLLESINPSIPDVLVCHQRWSEFMGSIGRPVGALVDLPFKHVWTGDFHQHRLINPTTSQKVLSPGSTCLQAVDEIPKKGIWLIFDDLTYTSHYLETRDIHRLDIETEEELKYVLDNSDKYIQSDKVDARIKMNIVDIEFNKAIPGALNKLVKCFEGKVHLMTKFKPTAKQHIDEQDKLQASRNGVDSCVEILTHNQPKQKEHLQQLISCTIDTQKYTLSKIKQKFIEEYNVTQQSTH